VSRVAVLASPRARTFRREPSALGELRATSQALGATFAACDDAATTKAALEAAREAGVGLIAVAGGDGTLGHVLAEAVAVYGEGGTPEAVPPLGLLRGGTMNTVANGLGVPRGAPVARLRLLAGLMANWHSGGHAGLSGRWGPGAGPTPPEVRERPSLKIGDRLGFLFGTGVFERFLSAYYAKGHGSPTVATAALTIGHLAASTLVGGAYARDLGARHRLTLEVDDNLWPERDFLTVAAGTVPEVGLGFKPFHHADDFTGAFHLIGVTAPAPSVVLDLPRVWLGRDLRPTCGRGVVARHATLTPPRGTPLAYMVDGDCFTTDGPLTVAVGPTARFVIA
jgi:diacylglycerol kinase (ATP)